MRMSFLMIPRVRIPRRIRSPSVITLIKTSMLLFSKKKGRDWCITVWAPEATGVDWRQRLDALIEQVPDWQKSVKYFCCQKEISPETKQPHLQGYVEFKSPRSGDYIWSVLRLTKGTHDSASAFVC